MVNRVVLVGRLANDPELKYTPSGIAVSSFRIAVDRPFSNQHGERETDFIDIVVWRQAAEVAADFLRGLDRPREQAPGPPGEENHVPAAVTSPNGGLDGEEAAEAYNDPFADQ